MKKQEILSLIGDSITTLRTFITPISDAEKDVFLKHAVTSVSVSDDLAAVFKEKCWAETLDDSSLTFTIRLKSTHEYIGYFQLKRINDSPEIGIDIVEAFQKKGYGYEVCQNIIDYLFQNTTIRVLQYNCFRCNIPSISLAEKLGAVRVGERVLLEYLKDKDVSEQTKKESSDFDLIIYEIRKI